MPPRPFNRSGYVMVAGPYATKEAADIKKRALKNEAELRAQLAKKQPADLKLFVKTVDQEDDPRNVGAWAVFSNA